MQKAHRKQDKDLSALLIHTLSSSYGSSFLILFLIFMLKISPMPPKDWKVKAGLVASGPAKKKKRISPIGQKKKQRIKENGTEKDFFHEVWKSRADEHGRHWCEVCGVEITEPKSWCFAHKLSKGRYPSMRYIPENIWLVCSIDCHSEQDKQNRWNDLQIIREIYEM